MPQLDKATIETLIRFRDQVGPVLTVLRLQASSQDEELAERLRKVARLLDLACEGLHWGILLGSAEAEDETSISDNL